MEPQVVSFDAQHCLAIAAAFIAIIGACASLIGGANSKADSLTKRIHEAAGEFREGATAGMADRCRKLKEQIDYYDGRYKKVQRAQLLLFVTVGIFVVCLTVFIGLALYASYSGVRNVMVYPLARYLVVGIGVGVAAGALVMLRAIGFHFKEVRDSYESLKIEMSDCKAGDKSEPREGKRQPAVSRAAEPLGSGG